MLILLVYLFCCLLCVIRSVLFVICMTCYLLNNTLFVGHLVAPFALNNDFYFSYVPSLEKYTAT
jgi:hypothetical protein